MMLRREKSSLEWRSVFIQREEESAHINSDGSNNLIEMALPQLAGRSAESIFLVVTLWIMPQTSLFCKPGLERDWIWQRNVCSGPPTLVYFQQRSPGLWSPQYFAWATLRPEVMFSVPRKKAICCPHYLVKLWLLWWFSEDMNILWPPNIYVMIY